MKGSAMNDDLVKHLRECANGMRTFMNERGDYGMADTAADRIEALQAALAQAEAERDGAYALAEKVARDYASKAKLRGWTTAPESAAMAAQHIAQNIRQLKENNHD
jgi:uncharacterized protein YigA (DUF484 family)